MEDPQPQPPPIPTSDSRQTRVMGNVRDSLLSELAATNPSISVNSDYGSHIQRRLQELFNSFHTPNHPPYALMIQRAVMESNNATGSTEEAISEFIKKEYEDLPWAHKAILGHHLRKLCAVGELLCTESGRYSVHNGNLGAGRVIKNALERSEGVEREKRLQGRENEKETQVAVLQIIETNEPSRMQERQGGWIQEEIEAHEHPIEWSEEQNKSGRGFLGTTEQQSLPLRQEIGVIGRTDMEEYHRGVVQAESELENFQTKKIQHIQLDEDTTFADPKQQLPKRQCQGRPPKLKPGADKSTSQRQKQLQPQDQVRGQGRPVKLHGWLQPQPYSRGRGRVRRHKLHRDGHRCEEQLQPEDQAQGPVSVNSLTLDSHRCEGQLQLEDQTQGPVNSLHLDALQCEGQLQKDQAQGPVHSLNLSAHRSDERLQPEDQDQGPVNLLNFVPEDTIYSSQPTESNPPATQAFISKQQLVVPISEGSLECKPTTGNEPSPTLMGGTSGTHLAVKSQVSASSSLLNVNKHDQPQHWNEGSPKRKLHENTTLRYLEQKPEKRRRRGRPPKAKPDAGYPGKLLLLDDSILNENPSVQSTSQKKQPSEHQSRVRGRGRPRKVLTDACQCKDKAQPQDQAEGLVNSPNLEPDEIQGQEQKRLQLKSQAQSWERPPNVESDANESYSLLPQGSSQDQGRFSKENEPAEQSQWQQLHTFRVMGRGQSQGRSRGRGRGRGRCRGILGRPPKPMLDANESKQLQQSQPCLGQGRRRGRPPKQKPESQNSEPMLDACQSCRQLNAQPMSDACQSYQQLQSQPCQVQDQILKRPAGPQPEGDKSASMLVYKRKNTLCSLIFRSHLG